MQAGELPAEQGERPDGGAAGPAAHPGGAGQAGHLHVRDQRRKPAPAPGPSPELNFTQAAAVNTANTTTTGASLQQLKEALLHSWAKERGWGISCNLTIDAEWCFSQITLPQIVLVLTRACL